LLIAGLFCSTIASAQDAGSASDDIVVTATKRAVSVQDVPLAVSALEGVALERTNAIDLTRLTNIDPTLQIQSTGAGDTQIILRGIQSAGASLVSVYMDEAVVTGSDFGGNGGRQTSLPFYDISRVEVLRGPQGTLFGVGSMAGSVRVIATKPVMNETSFKLSASAEDGAGTDALYEAYAVANLPIATDKLALRLTAWNTDGGGYLDRVAGDSPRTQSNTNDRHIKGARGILQWDAADDLSFTLTGVTQSLKVDDADNFLRTKGRYVIGTPTLGMWDEDTYLASFVGEYTLGVGTITAATSYYKKSLLMREDTSEISRIFGLNGFQYNEAQDRSVWSNEVRFSSKLDGPLQFVTGLFYEQDRDFAENVIGKAAGDGNVPCTIYSDCVAKGLASSVIFARALQQNSNQAAVFGQADYAIRDDLTFTAGIRHYRAKLFWDEFSIQGLRPSLSLPVQGAPVTTLDETVKQNNTSYNFSLGWRPTDDLSLYARAASGFRTGGINSLSSRQLDPSVPLGYDSDKLWNYEVGAKFSAFDRRLTVDSAFYYIDWSGQQVSQVTSSGVTSFIANAGTSSVKGAELRFTVRPGAGLTLSAGGTYTDSKLTEDQPTAATDPAAGRDGDRLPLVPKWAFAGQIGYEAPVGDGSAYAQTSFNYRGRAYTDFNENGVYVPMNSYFRADASIGFRRGEWDISLFVKNLTDKVAEIGAEAMTGVVAAGETRITTIRPRTVGLKLVTGF
jgi:outer membrane receptor protein involved in Fe transport